MRRGWRAAPLALAAVLAFGAGCSSSSSGSGDSSSTTAASSGGGSSTTTAAKETTTTKATSGSTPTGSGSGEAEAALMDASALGSGWDRDVSPDAPIGSVSQSFFAVPACSSLVNGASAAAATDSATANYTSSNEGDNPDVQLSIDYQVDIYESDADAAAVMELMASDEFATCYEAVLTASAGSRGTITSVESSPLDIPSASDLGVDGAAGVQVTGAITTSQGDASMLVHAVALQHGSALGFFTVTEAAIKGATPPALEVSQSAIEDAATKLAAIGS